MADEVKDDEKDMDNEFVDAGFGSLHSDSEEELEDGDVLAENKDPEVKLADFDTKSFTEIDHAWAARKHAFLE